MAKNHIDRRRKQYFQLSSQIAHLDNTQLRSLLENSESNHSSTGWGMNHVIVFRQANIFVKRLPVTKVEYDNLLSTKNFYGLPPSYHYGIDSPGFGVFRELVTHIKTTHWVLTEEIATFPLMYHYRILPFSGQWPNMEIDQLSNQATVRNYALDKANASHELVLFLECIPQILETWLRFNPHQLQKLLNDLRTTIDFLRTKGIIHFDAHFRNILTDGVQIYLTDFGLVLDQGFALANDETAFFEQNSLYDYGEVLRNLGHLIRLPYESCSEDEKRRIRRKYGIEAGLELYQVGAILLDHIEQIHTDADLHLDEFYVASIIKYRPIIALMQDFFVDMWRNKQKDTQLPHVQLGLLLQETGFLRG